MIKEIPFQCDLDNQALELKFQSELSKIVKHYDSLTIAEEAEAVKLLRGKINITNVCNWIPIFNEIATGFDVPIDSSIINCDVFDSCSLHVSRMPDDQEPARYPIVGLWLAFPRPIIGTSRPSLSKRKFMEIHPNPAIKHLVFQRLSLFHANSVVKTITLTPIAVREPQSSRTIKTVLMLTNQQSKQHIRYYIDHCPCCQKMNMLKIPTHAHGLTTSTYTPMECLNIDFIGPFPDQVWLKCTLWISVQSVKGWTKGIVMVSYMWLVC